MGAGHATDGGACQDAHAWRIHDNGTLILAVCDGLGSTPAGGDAARFVADALCESPALKDWLRQEGDEAAWRSFAESLLRGVRSDLEGWIRTVAEDARLDDFACTVQLVAVSDAAAYVVHIGDGRATARFAGEDQWVALFEPERGDAPNVTVPLSAPLSSEPEYWQAAARRWPGRAGAVAAMTDGCEMGAFECWVPDAEGRMHDPNRPFPGFFNPVAATLAAFARDGVDQSEVDQRWEAFVRGGLPRFASESDDRTMVFAVRTG